MHQIRLVPITFHGLFAKFFVMKDLKIILKNAQNILIKSSVILPLGESLKCIGEFAVTVIEAIPILGHLAFIIEMIASHCFNWLAGKIDRLNPSEVEDIKQQNLVSVWIDKHGENFLAHAVNENAAKILESGALKPAEMLLREGKEIEFEKAVYGIGRGKTRLPRLSMEEIHQLKHCLFSVEDKMKLNQLKNSESWVKGRKYYKEFSKYRSNYILAQNKFHKLDHPRNRKNVNEGDLVDVRNQMEEIGNKADSIWNFHKDNILLYVESTQLDRKSRGLSALLFFGEKISLDENKMPMLMKSHKVAFNSNLRHQFLQEVDRIASIHDCTRREIIIAFDCAQKSNKQIDTCLREKASRGHSIQSLMEFRMEILHSLKLNPEIRMSINTIFWEYGDMVILKGSPSEEHEIHEKIGDEAVMVSPLNSDTYYSINLEANEDILILGPQKILEPFKEKFKDKLVFFEELNQTQKKFFKIPFVK